jgi:hypothetical protein
VVIFSNFPRGAVGKFTVITLRTLTKTASNPSTGGNSEKRASQTSSNCNIIIVNKTLNAQLR